MRGCKRKNISNLFKIKGNENLISTYVKAAVIGSILGGAAGDAILATQGNLSLVDAAKSNYELNSVLNNEEQENRAREIAMLEGQEKRDAIQAYFEEGILQNPNIPKGFKAELIYAFSYKVIQRIGDDFDEETIARMYAYACTETVEEAPEKLEDIYDRIL